MALTKPINFNTIRAELVREVTRITGRVCILNMPVTQNSPRPDLPYLTVDIRSAAIIYGDDSQRHISGTLYNLGGPRAAIISFESFAQEREDAYALMALLQSAFGLETVLERLAVLGLAVCDLGNVVDLSELLNTGYEGRAQMDVRIGLTSNMTDDLGAIETVEVTGEVDTEKTIEEVEFTVTTED